MSGRAAGRATAVLVLGALAGGLPCRADAASHDAALLEADSGELPRGCTADVDEQVVLLPTTPPGGWVFYWENDTFEDTDVAYTNGLRYARAYRQRPKWGQRLQDTVCRSDWARRHELVPCPSDDGEDGGCWTFSYGWSLGQNMYTPADLERRELIVDDRPYAGWLYRGFTLQLNRPDRVHLFELDTGIVGPISLAGPTQIGFHRLIRALGAEPAHPRGWGNQIDHEPAMQLLAESAWRLRLDRWREGRARLADIAAHGTRGLGNVLTFAAVGATLRLGYNLPDDFGSGVIVSALARSTKAEERSYFYAFFKYEARGVLRNGFLAGNLPLFGDSHSVESRRRVDDSARGVTFRVAVWPERVSWLNHLTVTLTQVRRTKEFIGQLFPQKYDSLAIAYHP